MHVRTYVVRYLDRVEQAGPICTYLRGFDPEVIRVHMMPIILVVRSDGSMPAAWMGSRRASPRVNTPNFALTRYMISQLPLWTILYGSNVMDVEPIRDEICKYFYFRVRCLCTGVESLGWTPISLHGAFPASQRFIVQQNILN